MQELKEQLAASEERLREAAKWEGKCSSAEAEARRLEAALQAAEAGAHELEKTCLVAQQKATHLQEEADRLNAEVEKKDGALQQQVSLHALPVPLPMPSSLRM